MNRHLVLPGRQFIAILILGTGDSGLIGGGLNTGGAEERVDGGDRDGRIARDGAEVDRQVGPTD